MNWYFTGDTHGSMSRFFNNSEIPEGSNIIILGDAGFNYYLNKGDHKTKRMVKECGYTFYCVRGNHEERPENIADMKLVYDEEVRNYVYMQEIYPHIKYFKDGEIYNINGYTALVIGGAYSVDKYYRLSRKLTWFPQEQLSEEEMNLISETYKGNKVNFILSHTCPYSWQPTDLFLSSIDQTTVDNTMELWMNNFKTEIEWDYWLFGHFHDDRIVRPHVEMYYHDIEPLENLIDRWDVFDIEGYVDATTSLDPKFYYDK